MKRMIAKALTLVLVLSMAIVYAPKTLKVDVVSAATNGSSTTTTTPPKTTTPTNTTAPAPVVSAGSQIYTVVKGDMLWKIAKKFNLTLDQLLALNPQIKNRNLIYVGQKIVVGKEAAPVATTPTTPVATAKKLYHGFGAAANYRLGHTTLNITTASVVFDQDGKIVSLKWDVQEISPTLFPGWADEKTLSAADQAAFKAAIDDQWKTKWEEKDEYGMKSKALSGKEWWEQMGFYENYFKGKTVAEVDAWVNKYTDAVNHRPYKFAYPDKMTDADKIATANFTAAEKDMLVDVTTSATMSLQDDHSHFITALKEAYAARTEIK